MYTSPQTLESVGFLELKKKGWLDSPCKSLVEAGLFGNLRFWPFTTSELCSGDTVWLARGLLLRNLHFSTPLPNTYTHLSAYFCFLAYLAFWLIKSMSRPAPHRPNINSTSKLTVRKSPILFLALLACAHSAQQIESGFTHKPVQDLRCIRAFKAHTGSYDPWLMLKFDVFCCLLCLAAKCFQVLMPTCWRPVHRLRPRAVWPPFWRKNCG